MKAIDKLLDRLFGWLLIPSRGRAPFFTHLRRFPGEWSRKQQFEHFDKIAQWLWLGIGFIFGTLFILLVGKFLPQALLWLATPVIWFAILVAAVFVVRHHSSEIQNYQLGYFGERKVAEFLERLGRPDNFFVFHGFKPSDESGKKYGDIDHIIVCDKGVFCIETKAFRKKPGEQGVLSHTPGKPTGVLRFASGLEIPHNFLPKFEAKTRALHKQLNREVGGHGRVMRVIVFPEWQVKREGVDKWEFPCRPDEIGGFIAKSDMELDPEQVKRIAGFFNKKLRERVEEAH